MKSSKGQSTSGGPKSRQAASAIVRGQECFNRALEHIRRGNRERAIEALEAAIGEYTEAIRLDPEHATAYLLRARAHEEKGDEAKAEADLAKARTLEAN